MKREKIKNTTPAALLAMSADDLHDWLIDLGQHWWGVLCDRETATKVVQAVRAVVAENEILDGTIARCGAGPESDDPWSVSIRGV